MRLIPTLATIVAAAASFSLYNATPAGADEPMEISPDESRPATAGSADTFTGQVSVKPCSTPTPCATPEQPKYVHPKRAHRLAHPPRADKH